MRTPHQELCASDSQVRSTDVINLAACVGV